MGKLSPLKRYHKTQSPGPPTGPGRSPKAVRAGCGALFSHAQTLTHRPDQAPTGAGGCGHETRPANQDLGPVYGNPTHTRTHTGQGAHGPRGLHDRDTHTETLTTETIAM